ncbi:Hypothetical Protein FCC1311_056372 [Hondaea fermentalgiana]|uniref:Uncharacterized protein n=1 Tax=Hondaea fermentalgiana TaxID=2315210 RepID=A0A2R5GEQ3_9STRA|nr:Hypothetical Protein FCC1311_056372 [Hondaea fermentalgiana]|eukprot:GBG29416.1 Hypothetical Protein FCC1311_056372 [Hondaea fermentalgiana]
MSEHSEVAEPERDQEQEQDALAAVALGQAQEVAATQFPEAEILWSEPEDGVAHETGLQGVELWFIRHGESINNAILHRWGGLGTVLYPVQFEQDPRLTTKGRAVAAMNGARLVDAELEFDLVLSSAMIRTMQTAHEMFVKSGIVDQFSIVPFMSEIPLSWGGLPIYENIPRRRSRQIRILRREHGDAFVESIDWSLVGGPEGSNLAGLPPQGSAFLAWLGEQTSVQALVNECRSDQVVRIAVVTHSNLMKRDLQLRRKPGNSDIWMSTIVSNAGHLELEKIMPWYRGDVERKKVSIDRRISKRRAKAARKLEKYHAYAAEIQARRSLLTREARGRDDDASDSVTSNQRGADAEVEFEEETEHDDDDDDDDDEDDVDDDDDDDDTLQGDDADEPYVEANEDKDAKHAAKKRAKHFRKLSKKDRKVQEKLHKIERKTSKKVSKLEAKKASLDTYDARSPA